MMSETKVCNKCGIEKLLSSFTKRKASKDGYHYTCKQCTRKTNRDILNNYVRLNTDSKLLEYRLLNPYKRCNECGKIKPIDQFIINRQHKDGYNSKCRDCIHNQYKNFVDSMDTKKLNELADKKPTKICSDCKQVKDIREFSICRENLDGRSYYCKDCKIVRMQEYYRNTIDYRIEYRNNHREHQSERYANMNEKLKIEVLMHYGNGKCECIVCGEKRLACLSIDHINGGGSKHRNSISKNGCGGVRFYKWLKDNNYPDGYQTMCMNDQFIKSFSRKKN